jgi:NADH dehydrogenase
MHIVIVGGGFAGVKSALELSHQPDTSVTLISKSADFEYHGALYRSATGRSPLEVVIRLGDIFDKAKNVEVVIDKIVGLEARSKTVQGETGRSYGYDTLLLTMGNEKNFFDIPGLEDHADTMYTIKDTTALRTKLVNLMKLKQRDTVRVAVVGGGASGVELAGQLQTLASDVALRYNLTSKHVHVDLIESSPRLLPLLNPKASEIALRRLQSLGVNVMLGAKVLSCAEHTLKLEGGERVADVIVWTAGSRSVGFYANHPDIFKLERGKVVLDAFMRVPKYEDIFVLGDNALTQFSGMAQTAIHDAIYAARTIKHLRLNQTLVPYKAKEPVYVVPIGPRWAVVQQNGKIRSGYYGWLVRRRADLYIFKNFQPYAKAIKTWRKGNKLAKF